MLLSLSTLSEEDSHQGLCRYPVSTAAARVKYVSMRAFNSDDRNSVAREGYPTGPLALTGMSRSTGRRWRSRFCNTSQAAPLRLSGAQLP